MNGEDYLGRPIAEVPRRAPTDQACMGKKKQKQEGELVRDENGNALFAGYCKCWPGKGTDHVGEGRCKLHAGASDKGQDHPQFEHGLFSDYLDPEDRRATEALADMDDAEKLDELINWRLARLRRYLRETMDDDQESFFQAFDRVVSEATRNGQLGLSAEQIRELEKMLSNHDRAAQQEIDLVRKLIKTRNKIAEGEDVNVSWRQALAGGDT